MRPAAALGCLLVACHAAAAAASKNTLVSIVKDPPYIQRGCNVMYSPGSVCYPNPAPFVESCCTPGHGCLPDTNSVSGSSCQVLPEAQLTYKFGAAAYGECLHKVLPGQQCGGGGGECGKYDRCSNTGPWLKFCCPDGFTCQPSSGDFRVWACASDVTDRPPVPGTSEVLQYPPRPLPPGACACRTDADGKRVPRDCLSPWDHAAGDKLVPPPVQVGPNGRFVSALNGADIVLKGVNWFGWNVGQFNVDGLWAYCDDNYTASTPPCQPDGEIPPHFPEPSITAAGIKRIGGVKFWGKRTLTNDFATVVHRIKLLGFNAVRLPFQFADLNEDLPATKDGKAEFMTCMLDNETVVAAKTLDPMFAQQLFEAGATVEAPPYLGPAHPPPADPSNPVCDVKWRAKYAPHYRNGSGLLHLTQCNWYLPQGEGTPAIQRFLWQIQYIISQGLYVIPAFHPTREPEANVVNPRLFTRNWRNLWRMLRDLPGYETRIKGRVLADLINEPSRWGCQWDRPCTLANETSPSCAPGVWLYAAAASGIHSVDRTAPILIEGMGQDAQRGQYVECAPTSFPGMTWGEGFITHKPALERYQISDASGMFAADEFAKISHPVFGWPGITIRRPALPNQIVLSPHLYPRSITNTPEYLEDTEAEITLKWDISWGWKSGGEDKTSSGDPLRRVGLIIGEFGTRDDGDNAVANRDTTTYTRRDRAWLGLLSRYLRAISQESGPVSWMWWSWNANSVDTKGLVGPQTTWREVQWTKIRLLIREFGLVPWYCRAAPDRCTLLPW